MGTTVFIISVSLVHVDFVPWGLVGAIDCHFKQAIVVFILYQSLYNGDYTILRLIDL